MKISMEIEKKFTIKQIPEHLEQYSKKVMEQGYLCPKPVVRIRKSNEEYILTYKSKIGLEEKKEQNVRVCQEVEVPLDKAGYEHLKAKIDNQMVCKTRYIIPLSDGLKAELDIFEGYLKGLQFVEVEFPTEEAAEQFVPPDWFGNDVTLDRRYSNNYLATIHSLEELNLDNR